MESKKDWSHAGLLKEMGAILIAWCNGEEDSYLGATVSAGIYPFFLVPCRAQKTNSPQI